jgi:hypothetical protein
VTSIRPDLLASVDAAVSRFCGWLESFGPYSYDHQSFFAGPIGGAAKALYYRNKLVGTAAVAPMIFCEAFVPSARQLFFKPLRFPIADAHYAMGFAFLSEKAGDRHYLRARTFLDALEQSRCPGFAEYCWGYPFDWVTGTGIVKAGTPLITSTPYAYEAFRQIHEIDRWRLVCGSIVRHVTTDIRDFPAAPSGMTCGYAPDDESGGVINASAYRACMLTFAAADFSDERYWQIARQNLRFVLDAQQPDGSWYYSADGHHSFVDHFHTCFVMKALAKIEAVRPDAGCADALARGVEYYLRNLLDGDGLPKPFSKAPRLTVYKRELYDYAECINLCVLLKDRFGELGRTLNTVLADVAERWTKSDGSFRSRELLAGWDNVPMHRWAQSQMFRSLAFLLHQERPAVNSEPSSLRSLSAVGR